MKIIFSFLCITTFIQASEYATFESLYVANIIDSWWIVIMLALAIALIPFSGGGSIAAAATYTGTFIGNMMGLSGIAATNAGLALMGGGSIATGGFGIAGGMTVLSVALTFSTEVIIDYSVNKTYESYSYNEFIEQSKKMPTLPIIRNDNGTKAYEEAYKILDKIDLKNTSIYSNNNIKKIKSAIAVLENLDEEKLFGFLDPNNKDLAKKHTLISLLYFQKLDYNNAKLNANKAIEYARKEDIKRTMPAFIYAVSSLYEENFDFDNINKNYFRYSILAEPDNKLIPILFATYLDRLIYRINNNNNTISIKTLEKVKDITTKLDDNNKQILLTMFISRYFTQLKLKADKIRSLTKSQNETIKYNKKTLIVIQKSFEEYNYLLEETKKTIVEFNDVSQKIEENNIFNKFNNLINIVKIPIINFVGDNGEDLIIKDIVDKKEEEDKFINLLKKYKNDSIILNTKIQEFIYERDDYFEKLKKEQEKNKLKKESLTQEKNKPWWKFW